VRPVMTPRGPHDIPPCLIHIDKEGKWYHKGREMIRQDLIDLFYQHLHLDAEGRYIITWRGDPCYVEVEDTAFVITRVERVTAGKPRGDHIRLRLSDHSEEPLSPDTLFVGKENVLYCKVKSRAFPARFNRAAYYQLARHIEEENGAFHLMLGGGKHVIPFHEGRGRQD
jgi:hypothetical protein